MQLISKNSQFLRLGLAGMRGVVGNGLDTINAVNYASALGTYLYRGTVVVGRDTRTSSALFKHVLVSALMECGCSVIDAGIVPAPFVHFLVKHLGAQGGVLIGAGHHPKGWNAIVPLNSQGAYFTEIQTQSLLDIYHSHYFKKTSFNKIGKIKKISDSYFDDYLKIFSRNLNISAIKSKGYTVVTDFCNGSGSILTTKFAKLLGIKIIPLNNELIGYLPHEPEPRPRTARQVKALMSPLNANIGFVLNSDVSRLSIVTDSQETLSEELTYPILASHILNKSYSNATFITNICSSRTLDDLANKYKATLIKTAVGQANIIESMTDLDALIAGDGSGSAGFNNGINGYDSFMSMAVILEAMAENNINSTDLVQPLQNYYITKNKVTLTGRSPYNIINILKNTIDDADSIDESDGLRFDWHDGWCHIRVSLTEPIVRIITEWKDKKEAIDLAKRIKDILEKYIYST